MRWREALVEMEPYGLVRRVYEAEMEGRRGREGGQKRNGLIILK